MTVVDVRQLRVAYGDVVALDEATARFEPGRLTAVVGPNGAGKSTLIKAMVGLVTPHSGSITVGGRPAAAALDALAWVPQRAGIDFDFPILVREVVAQGRHRHLGLLRRPKAADRDATAQAIARVDIADLADRPIGALSGGQQQRVFVARALAQDAPVLLLDEPFAGVDVASERAILAVLRGLADEGRTVIVVHHDLATVGEFFDDAVVIRQRVVAAGSVGSVLTSDVLALAYGVRLGGHGGSR